MKKLITILLILLLIPIVYSDIEEPETEEYKPPVNGIGYFIRITLPEFFIGIGKYFNRDERINWKLQQLERRRMELEYILEKLNNTQSEEWRERYEDMIRIISKRQERNLIKLERYSKLVKMEKRERVKLILENRDILLNDIKERYKQYPDVMDKIEEIINQSNRIRDRLVPITTQVETNDGAKKIVIHGVS